MEWKLIQMTDSVNWTAWVDEFLLLLSFLLFLCFQWKQDLNIKSRNLKNTIKWTFSMKKIISTITIMNWMWHLTLDTERMKMSHQLWNYPSLDVQSTSDTRSCHPLTIHHPQWHNNTIHTTQCTPHTVRRWRSIPLFFVSSFHPPWILSRYMWHTLLDVILYRYYWILKNNKYTNERKKVKLLKYHLCA